MHAIILAVVALLTTVSAVTLLAWVTWTGRRQTPFVDQHTKIDP